MSHAQLWNTLKNLAAESGETLTVKWPCKTQSVIDEIARINSIVAARTIVVEPIPTIIEEVIVAEPTFIIIEDIIIAEPIKITVEEFIDAKYAPEKPYSYIQYDSLDYKRQTELEQYYPGLCEEMEAMRIEDEELKRQEEEDTKEYINKLCNYFPPDDRAVYAVYENKEFSYIGGQKEIMITELINNMKCSLDGKKMAYTEELLTGATLKPYFDFDIPYTAEQDAIDNRILDLRRAIATVITFFKYAQKIINMHCDEFKDIKINREFYNYIYGKYPKSSICDWDDEFNMNMLTFLHSCGKQETKEGEPEKWKNSFHIILNCGITIKDGKVMKNIMELENFVAELSELGVKHFGSPIEHSDLAIYKKEGGKSLFRMPYAAKYVGSDRLMIPFEYDFVKKQMTDIDASNLTVRQARMLMISIGNFKEDRLIYYITKNNELNVSIESSNEIFNLFASKFPEEAKHFNNPQWIDYRLQLSRTSGSYCPLCDDENRINISDTQWHGRDSNAFITKSKGSYIYHCRWSKKTVCLNPEYSAYAKESDNIDENDKKQKAKQNRKIHIPTIRMDELIKKMNKTKLTFQNRKKTQFAKKSLHTSAKYVSDVPEIRTAILNKESSIIAISANMGEGKSRAINMICDELIEKYPDDKILFTSPRIAITKKFASEKSNFVNYLEKAGTLNDNRIICQLDSVHRIDWPNKNGISCRLVVLDECDQQLDHIISKTFTSSKMVNENIEKLKYIIRYAEQVVIMSANITWREIKWIKEIRCDKIVKTINENNGFTEEEQIIKANRSLKVFVNKNEEATKYNICMCARESEVISLAIKSLKNGNRIYIACNGSVKTIESIRKAMTFENGSFTPILDDNEILTIHSENLTNPNVIAALENPNEEWGKYRLIIASPSVQSGVSYDIENVFDEVYGIFINYTNKSGDACQMLRRVRHPKSQTIHVSIEYKYHGAPIKKNDVLKAVVSCREPVYNSAMAFIPSHYNKYGAKELENSQYVSWYCMIMADANADKLFYIRNFIQHQLEYGNNVISFSDIYKNHESKEEEDKYKYDYKEAAGLKKVGRKIVKREECEQMIEAELISDEEYRKLSEKKTSLTKEEKIKSNKYFIHNYYNINPEISHEDIDYIKLMEKSTQKQYKNCSFYQFDDIDKGLIRLQNYEIAREYNQRNSVNNKNTNQLILESINTKYLSKRHAIFAQWMKLFDIDKYYGEDGVSSRLNIYEEYDFKDIIKKISEDYLLKDEICTELNIPKSKSLTFSMALRKINGLIQAEFGFTFRKMISKEKDAYTVCGEEDICYMVNTNRMYQFNPKIFTGLYKANDTTPCAKILYQYIERNITCADITLIILDYCGYDTSSIKYNNPQNDTHQNIDEDNNEPNETD